MKAVTRHLPSVNGGAVAGGSAKAGCHAIGRRLEEAATRNTLSAELRRNYFASLNTTFPLFASMMIVSTFFCVAGSE